MSATHRVRLASSFRLIAAFACQVRVRAFLLALLFVLALQPPLPARAACDVKDVLSAMKAGVETAQTCQPVCEDKYRCYGAAGLAIILTEISRKKGQDKVDSFCSTAFKSLNELLGALQLLADLTQDQIDELSASLSDIAGDITVLLSILQCACKTEQLQLKNEASFGACANDVLKAVGCGEIDWTTATIGGCDPVGSFLGDVVDEGIDALVSLGCGWLYDCADGSAGPVTSNCISGTQADQSGKCHYCSEFGQHFITQGDGLCGCEPPYTALRWGKRVIACECKPPNRLVDGQCLCPLGAQLINGVCQCALGTQANAETLSCVNICNNAAGEILDQATNKCVACPSNSRTVYISGSLGHCEACDYGQKVSADHKSCVPACAPGQIMGGLMLGKDQTADPSAYQCQICPDNTYAGYDKAGSSRGVCLPCADGTSAKAGATRCLPLNCGPGSYQDPDDPHACKSCPPTQIYIPTEKKSVISPLTGEKGMQVVPGHCGCGENQVLQGDTCMCAQGATKINLPQAPGGLFACACPAGARLDQAASACVCPAGAKLDPSKNACTCPRGQRLEGGKCIPSAQRVTRPEDCSTLGARYINNPKNPATCIRCPAGRIANANRNACVRPAAPSIPAAVPPAARPPRAALRCPPGMMPNATATTCIRVIKPRRAVPPALSWPPARRAVPRFRIPAR